jgi:hypothetical protein
MSILTGAEIKTTDQSVVPAAGATATAEPVAPAVPEFIRLPAGTVLTEAQALALASDRTVRVIVIAGAVDCGKTTLLSSVYELFQTGPVKAIQFAGCDTFPAFEKRCYLSRAESGNESADTVRTIYDGPHPEYLHLKIQTGDSEADHIDFLFTDVSGEMFEHARNSTDECKRLTFLRRASHFLVFLDCEKALLADKKWGMVQDAKSLLQSCLDSSMLESTCFVTVVWAKCDFFEAANNKDTVSAFVKEVEDDFRASFGERIPKLKFHRTAARPTRFPNLKMGYGVRELLGDWIAIWPQGRRMQLEPSVDNEGHRESELFAKRHNRQDGNA